MANTHCILVENVDFPMLKKQKLSLVEVIMQNDKLTQDQTDSLDGILNLLDYMTDHFDDVIMKDKRSPINCT
jgi:hypothetical protein